MSARQAKAKRCAPVRRERLEARISSDQKDLFLRAAEIQGRTLTDFVIASVHAAAVHALEEMETIRLTKEESRVFAEAILDPGEPGPRLKAAAQRFLSAG